MQQVVRVINAGAETFVDMYANQPFEIAPGAEMFVPLEAVWCWMGHPGLRDHPDGRITARTDEFKRIKGRYGWWAAMTPEEWNGVRPNLEVYSLAGERYITLLDDPEGRHVAPQSGSEQEMLLDYQKRLESELTQLRERLDRMESGQLAAEDIPEDEPRQVPVGASKRSRS
jgi:hypothetical protein